MPPSRPTHRCFRPGARSTAAVEKAHLGKVAHAAEQAVKVPLFRCRDCGDCSLPEIAYVCPESVCAKNQRNGPCGGTRDGLCEVYDTECIWSQAYERLKAYGEEESMLDGPVVIKDNALARTSAWANTFLGRDHQARPSGRRRRNMTSLEIAQAATLRPMPEIAASSGSSPARSTCTARTRPRSTSRRSTGCRRRPDGEADLHDGDHADEGRGGEDHDLASR